MNITKYQNLEDAKDAFEILTAFDYDCRKCDEFHFKVNGHLNIYPTTKCFYDEKYHDKGMYDDLVYFVRYRFEIEKRV